MDVAGKKSPLGTIVREIKHDIGKALSPEIEKAARKNAEQEALKATMFNVLMDMIRMIVINELKEELIGDCGSNGQAGSGENSLDVITKSAKVGDSLAKVEQKLSEIGIDILHNDSEDIERTSLDDFDDIDLATIKKLEAEGVRLIYPNLKYRKPKYKNVESILKYIESKDDKGGVKLVIMNFND